jgi:hypothetical protein
VSLTHPEDIEREIQRQIAAASATRTKASLFNLVIFRRAFSRDPSAEALGYLLGRRPARLILIESGTDGPAEAFVSARCHPDPKNLELCFQEIRIQGGSDDVGRDPGFWSPLLIRDIPVYVWWLEELRGLDGALGRLAPFADRFLGDSTFAEERGEDPVTALQALAERVHAAGLPCADVSWHRTFALRLGTARLFDPPAAREALGRIRQIRLEGGRRVEGLLYFLWLASRLGWSPQRVGGAEATMLDGRGNEVRLRHERIAALEQGMRVQVELQDGQTLALECPGRAPAAQAGEGSGCGLLSGPGERREHVALRVPTPGEVLLREVDRHATDPIYADVLGLFAAARPEGGEE